MVAASDEENLNMENAESLSVPWYWRCQQYFEKSRLMVYAGLLLVVSVGNQLYFKRMTSSMPNYCFFLSFLTTLFYLPIFGVLSGKGLFTSADSGSLQRFAVMGLFDGLASVCMILGGVRTSGTMQVVLSQGVIPCTLLCSILLLGKKFHLLQYAGAATITFGIVLSKLGSSQSGAEDSDVPFFNLFFLISVVPMALSSCFKEVAFRGVAGDLDVNVLQFWVTVFQTGVTILTMPIYTMSILGPQQVPYSEMVLQFSLGGRCLFLKENTVVDNCGSDGQKACDTCEDALSPVIIYFTFNVLYNIFTMLVIKHGSATLSFLISTLRMPLASVAFSSTVIMGADAVQPTRSDLISVVVIICGLSTYRVGGRHLKRQLEKDEKAMSSPSTWLLSDSPPSPSKMQSPGGTIRERAKELGWKFVPMIMTGINAQPVFVLKPDGGDLKPRSPERVRTDLIRRLGAASPLNSPKLRQLSPPRQLFPDPSDEVSHKIESADIVMIGERQTSGDSPDSANVKSSKSTEIL